MDVNHIIAQELGVQTAQVERTVALMAEGATVPFIARYRKDVTGNLDDMQIHAIEERHAYLTELLDRKKAILESIETQGKLTPELQARIDACFNKTELEDLYLPYKPKRRTRAMIARERGLEPLADRIWAQTDRSGSLEALAEAFVDIDKDVPNAEAALAGARDILAERVAEDADLRAAVRGLCLQEGQISSSVKDEWKGKPSKFEMYYTFSEPATRIPSHRYLAIARGVEEGVLESSLEVPEERIIAYLAERVVREPGAITAPFLRDMVEDAWHRLMATSLETDIRSEVKDRADTDALKVFQANLKALLLAAPLGGKRVVGLDPGFRTGVKVAVVDETGRFLANDVIYPVPPLEKVDAAKRTLLSLIKTHKAQAIAIGNGTASRETDAFVRAFMGEHPELNLISVVVSEAGASVYSASEVAREEFPSLDVTVRGAISIGRRLQDPLAELVKIDPKAIGVGQYQHDVNQKRLKKSLDDVVEGAVNFVGVEVNTASASLLRYVAGIGESLARAIVNHRNENGPFTDRASLREVPRFGPKAFQQAAGFLRIRNGKNPLDNSAVHPEHYPVVERMAADLGVAIQELTGNENALKRLSLERYQKGEVGTLTLQDIVEELKKPGRDPRDQFEAVTFDPEVTEISHLKEGMVLQGVITNVTDFGCFVDIGVHQDGLVHISRISDRFVQDPKEVVQPGQKVRVKVLAVEPSRKRISLTMKDSEVSGRVAEGGRDGGQESRGGRDARPGAPGGGPRGGHDRGSERGGSRGPQDRGQDSRGGSRGPAPAPAPAKDQPFNNPFAALASLKKK